MANTKDYNEIWLEAMRTVAESIVSGLEFDRTVKCQIIRKKEGGIYIVRESDTVTYEATIANSADIDQYEVDEWVYVLIPSGNSSNTKLIVGKYLRDTSESAMGYVPPLGSMLDMTGNILPNDIPTEGILANGVVGTKPLFRDANGNDTILFFEQKDSDGNIISSLGEDVVHNHIYDTFGVKASFKTLFNGTDMITGNYGLVIYLYREEGDPVILTLDNSDMFGNPYGYMAYFTQSKKFDISNIGTIKGINMHLYQGDNFYYYDGEEDQRYDCYQENGDLKPDNIFVKDIYVSFGQDLYKIEDNTFKLSTYGPAGQELNYNTTDTSDNYRNIYATWYNKDEFNEFVGFSDGVVDPDYSEDNYDAEYYENWAGGIVGAVEGIPRLRESLQIYVNANKFEEKLESLHLRVSTNLMLLISNLSDYLSAYGMTNEKVYADNLYNKLETEYLPSIIIAYDGIDDNTEEKSVLDYYKEYLAKAMEVYTAIKEEKAIPTLPGDDVKTTIPDLIGNLNGTWSNSLVPLIDQLFTVINDAGRADTVTYINRCKQEIDQYILMINSLFTDMQNLLAKTQTQITSLERRLANKDLTTFEEEYEEFVKAHENRYCIYWYRKNLTAEGDKWSGGEGWERITEFPSLAETPGMPDINTEPDPDVYYKRSSRIYTPLLDREKAKDCFKAVLFFNHIKHESNVLEFENQRPPDGAGDMADIAGALYLEHGLNSSDTYQKYNSSFKLVSASDGMINRELKVRFDGVEQKDEALIGATVYWYIPKNNTMLAYDEIKLANEGFSKLSSIPEDTTDPYQQEYLTHKREKYECFFKSIRNSGIDVEPPVPMESDIKFYYLIAKNYSIADSQNEIVCVVVADGYEYEASKVFTFSTYGTSGTDFTLSIVPIGTQYAIEDVANEINPLELKAKFSGYNGAIVENPPAITYSWYGINNEGNALPHIELLGDAQLEELNIEKETGAIYMRVGKDFNVDTDCLYYVLQCEAKSENIDDETKADQTLKLISYYPVPYAFGPYYIDGATTVAYNSSGTSPNYENTPYKLYYLHSGEEYIPFDASTNSDRPLRWQLWHFKSNGKLHHIAECDRESREYMYWDETKTLITNVEDIEAIAKTDSFLPKMKYNAAEDLGNLKAVQGYTLSPVNLYVESKGDCQLYSVAVAIEEYFEDSQYKEKIVFAQPIWIGQNQWESPMLNSWDESLTIDEKNGTILSTMVGAGYKDEQNRFHGVLMGNVEVAKLEFGNKQGVGLYGFHEGAQSFCWNVDGTGFIGKSGRGRINLDGNKGSISSATWDFDNESGSSGMKIDLDDAVIKMRGVEVPEDKDANHSEILIQVANPYFKINSVDGNTLMYVGDSTMYLQSNDYSSTAGYEAGMKINLAQGKIDAYNFKLTTSTFTLSSDGSPYIAVKNPKIENRYLLYMSSSSYYLESDDYAAPGENTNGSGVKFDLNSGKLTAYKFNITAYGANSNKVVINSGAPDSGYPLQIGAGAVPPFQVSWDGHLMATRVTISGNGDQEGVTYDSKIGGWIIGATTLKSSSGKIVLNGATGEITCSNAANQITFYAGGGGNGGGYSGGYLAQYKDLIVTDSLSMYGKMHITNTEYAGGDQTPITATMPTGDVQLLVSGDSVISGKMLIDSAATTASSCATNAQLMVAGNSIISGKILIDSTATTASTFPTYGTEPIQMHVAGATRFTGNIIMGTAESAARIYAVGYGQDMCLYFDKNQIYVAGPIASIASENIYLGKTAGNGNDIVSTTTVKGTLIVNSDTKIQSPYTFYVKDVAGTPSTEPDDNNYLTLPGYIKKYSDALFNITFTQVDMGTTIQFGGSAQALHNSSKVETLKAPASVGAAGQFLKATDAAGGTEWATITPVPSFPQSASKYLRTVYVPSSTSYSLEWGDIPSPDLSAYVTTTALSSASVNYATSAGSAGSATDATYATYVVAGDGNTSSNGYGSYVAGVNGTGNRTVYDTGLKVSTISTTSSRRFKHNIEPLEDSSLLYKLKPVSFIYNNDESERIRYGFIAEDILPLNKHLVDVEKNGEINALYYNSIFTLAIAEIQKLRKELNELKASL